MNLSFSHIRIDAHITHPGSRGGHIVGYRKGEPIYGTIDPKRLSHAHGRLSVLKKGGKDPGLGIDARTKKTTKPDKLAAWHHVLKEHGHHKHAEKVALKLKGLSITVGEEKPKEILKSGDIREAKVRTSFGDDVILNIHRNISSEGLETHGVGPNERGWLLPSGDFYITSPKKGNKVVVGVFHRHVVKALGDVGFISEKQVKEIIYGSNDPKYGVAVIRAGRSNAFYYGEVPSSDDTEEFETIKTMVKRGRKKSREKSGGVLFLHER